MCTHACTPCTQTYVAWASITLRLSLLPARITIGCSSDAAVCVKCLCVRAGGCVRASVRACVRVLTLPFKGSPAYKSSPRQRNRIRALCAHAQGLLAATGGAGMRVCACVRVLSLLYIKGTLRVCAISLFAEHNAIASARFSAHAQTNVSLHGQTISHALCHSSLTHTMRDSPPADGVVHCDGLPLTSVVTAENRRKASAKILLRKDVGGGVRDISGPQVCVSGDD